MCNLHQFSSFSFFHERGVGGDAGCVRVHCEHLSSLPSPSSDFVCVVGGDRCTVSGVFVEV